MSELTVKEILRESYLSTAAFTKYFMPEHFSRPFSVPHLEIFKQLDNEKANKVVIAAPRGVGKTSINNLGFAAKRILFGQSKYILMVGASQTAAVEQSENLKQELISNERISGFFGNVKTNNFSKEQWDAEVVDAKTKEIISSTRILPVGPGQKVRGRKYGWARPDLILIDDLENDENVMSDDQRLKLSNWFHSALLNSVDRARAEWRVVMIGTVLHHDALLENLLNKEKNPSWNSIRLSLCNDDYESCWPEYMSTKAVRALANEFRARGELSSFCREYMNKPIAAEDQSFREEYFNYYDPDTQVFDPREFKTIVLTDPAKTISKGACFSAIVGVSVSMKHRAIYVRDIVSKKVSPQDLYEEIFEMADRIGAKAIGIEVTSLNEFIMQPIRNHMSMSGKYYELIELKPRDKKANRVGALIPYYRQGLVKHNPTCCKKLELRLMEWPRPAGWDELDAYAHIIPAMDIGQIFFASTADEEEDAYERLLADDRREDELPNYIVY